jgi:hypothetical protein
MGLGRDAVKYVVDYEIWTGAGNLRNKGQRDVEINTWSQTYNVIQARDRLEEQIILADPADRIVVTDIRPA